MSSTILTAPAPACHYRITIADVHAHLFHVRLTIAEPLAEQVLSLPVWIPGSYLVREFAKNLQNLRAHQAGRPVALQQQSKQRWQAACQTGQPLVLEYQVYANDPSVRTASLDAQRGFFNGTSLCLRAEGLTEQACLLDIVAPGQLTEQAAWQCATALTPVQIDAHGFGCYQAADYDELADSPVEMGAFWSANFMAAGVPHRLVVAGATPAFDGQRLLQDTQRICETVIAFWHGTEPPPFQNYVFLLNATADGYGGLEHRHSTALICARKDLPRLGQASTSEGYTTLLGLISHEYFHTWNVKRLRPAEFARYDYHQENYTQLLWFFEGFTSYYDDLLLHRAGLIDDASYLKLLGKTIAQVQQTPGRLLQTVAQASFDAWVKYYRQDENTPNATISYYTKGALVALCLDLTLRQEGQTSLDAVMQALWQRCAGGPMTEADVRAVLLQLAGRSLDAELDAWVHSTAELPVAALLAAHGMEASTEPAPIAQALGLRATDKNGIRVQGVLRGSLAERAGLAAGDEWLGLEVQGQGWRLQQLADVPLYAGHATQVTALVGRGDRLLRLALELPAADAATTVGHWKITDATRASQWLSGR
ncbi:MAG: peptidase M61 [Giesbergeria sp.]|uniref:M61 family metallopeptidase n=1 Tax=Giesbergeria sp. TaxID=2818473 RepID=UPI0026375FC4|nr:peptidase M61 [Giesbergeria sp.]MDD2608081.1 peptidase M61 [Giesbergeria sp.]